MPLVARRRPAPGPGPRRPRLGPGPGGVGSASARKERLYGISTVKAANGTVIWAPCTYLYPSNVCQNEHDVHQNICLSAARAPAAAVLALIAPTPPFRCPTVPPPTVPPCRDASCDREAAVAGRCTHAAATARASRRCTARTRYRRWTKTVAACLSAAVGGARDLWSRCLAQGEG